MDFTTLPSGWLVFGRAMIGDCDVISEEVCAQALADGIEVGGLTACRAGCGAKLFRAWEEKELRTVWSRAAIRRWRRQIVPRSAHWVESLQALE